MPTSEDVARGLIVAGASLSVAGLLTLAWTIYGPRRSEPERTSLRFQASVTPTIMPFLPAAPTAPPATPTPDPWTYDGLDLGVGSPLTSSFDGLKLIEDFTPKMWTPEMLNGGGFEVGSGVGLVWMDDQGRLGIWLHSGLRQTASPFQDYLERDEHGYLRTHQEAEAVLQSMLGRTVFFVQDDNYSLSEIVAAVRIPPVGVPSVEGHVGDLVDYLAFGYPESGFGTLPRPSLTIMFCGLRLGGEEANPAVNRWQQARFIIGLTPVEAP